MNDIGPSGHYPGLDQEMIMDELELGFRVARALEDEYLGMGPLFDAEVAEWEHKDELEKMKGTRKCP